MISPGVYQREYPPDEVFTPDPEDSGSGWRPDGKGLRFIGNDLKQVGYTDPAPRGSFSAQFNITGQSGGEILSVPFGWILVAIADPGR